MPSSRTPEGGGPTQFGRALRETGPLFGSGIQMAAAVVLMFFVGRWIDGKLDTSPWMMLLGILLGAVAGLVNFIRMATRQHGAGNRRPDDHTNGPAE